MTFSRDFALFPGWVLAVMRAFLRARPRTTVAVSGLVCLSHLSSLAAFVLPLKVILLAGSEGVPSYFRGFITAQTKSGWIVGAAAGAIGCYVLTVAINALVARLSAHAGAEVTNAATKMHLVHNQGHETQTIFSGFCQISANLVFVAVLLALGLWLDPHVFIFLIGALVAETGWTGWVLRERSGPHSSRTARYVRSRTVQYVGLLGSVNFLAAFVLALLPFLLGGSYNTLIALLSIIVVRRVMSALAATVRIGVELGRKRARVDALVFAQVQLAGPDAPSAAAGTREALLRFASGKEVAAHCGAPVRVHWSRSATEGVAMFHLSREDTPGAGSLQLQVFGPRQTHLIENETLLFRHLPRQALQAPERVARFGAGHYQCQIVAFGRGRFMLPADWSRWEPALLFRNWKVKPPVDLRSAFVGGYALLADRLGPALVDRLRPLATTDEKLSKLEHLSLLLPSLQDLMRATPLYVHNPDIRRSGTAIAGPRAMLIMAWGRWTLEPIGAKLVPNVSDERLAQALAAVRTARDDLPQGLDPAWLRVVEACFRLDRVANRGPIVSVFGVLDNLLHRCAHAASSGLRLGQHRSA